MAAPGSRRIGLLDTQDGRVCSAVSRWRPEAVTTARLDSRSVALPVWHHPCSLLPERDQWKERDRTERGCAGWGFASATTRQRILPPGAAQHREEGAEEDHRRPGVQPSPRSVHRRLLRARRHRKKNHNKPARLTTAVSPWRSPSSRTRHYGRSGGTAWAKSSVAARRAPCRGGPGHRSRRRTTRRRSRPRAHRPPPAAWPPEPHGEPSAHFHCCASVRSAEAGSHLVPSGRRHMKDSCLPAPLGLPPNLRAPVPTCRSHLHTRSSQSSKTQAAVIAAKPKAITQHPPNRLFTIVQHHVTAQVGIDSSRVQGSWNKTSCEAHRSQLE